MILSDCIDLNISIGIDNQFDSHECITMDIAHRLNKVKIKLDLRRTKILQQHLKDMIDQYEGKNNSNPTTL